MPKKKPLEIKPGDIVACYWMDHTGYKSVPLVPGSLRLIPLVTYGEVMSLNGETLELIQEKQLEEGGEANDACAVGIGMTKKIVVYRPVGEVEY